MNFSFETNLYIDVAGEIQAIEDVRNLPLVLHACSGGGGGGSIDNFPHVPDMNDVLRRRIENATRYSEDSPGVVKPEATGPAIPTIQPVGTGTTT